MVPAGANRPEDHDVHAELEVLVADGDRRHREQLRLALIARGHRVTEAADGAQASGVIESHVFDLVIAMVELDGDDGLDLLRRLRRISPTTDVILVAAHGSIADAIAATKARGVYLAMPLSIDEVIDAVSSIAERRAVAAELASTPAASLDSPLLVGRSPAMVQLRRNAEVISHSDGAVLIVGESGTGKELVAKMIHGASPRRHRPMVTVNCAAFPETLLDAELFGHERGAFTGAATRREGRFESADGGTLFLDEIGEMPVLAQAKLLRVLEQGTYQRLGSNVTMKADVRLISATNKDLDRMVVSGRFREDLLYRIKLFRLVVPPLRARRADLAPLVEHFCRKHTAAGQAPPTLSPWAWGLLREHTFPGNVRELEHAIRHAIAFAGGGEIEVEHLPQEITGDEDIDIAPTDGSSASVGEIRSLSSAVSQFEHEYLLQVLQRAHGNRSLAASLLGISRKSLWAKLKRHSQQEPSFSAVSS